MKAGGGCLVVIAQWSEHWQLKPGFNSRQLPAFHLLLLCLKANSLSSYIDEYLTGLHKMHV